MLLLLLLKAFILRLISIDSKAHILMTIGYIRCHYYYHSYLNSWGQFLKFVVLAVATLRRSLLWWDFKLPCDQIIFTNLLTAFIEITKIHLN